VHAGASYDQTLGVLLDALQPPAPLARQARAIREQLAETPAGDHLPTAVHDLADLILRVRYRAEEERQSWEALLERVSEKLHALYQQVQGTVQRIDTAHEAGRSVETTLERQVDDLRWRLSSAGNPEQMRSIIRDQLAMMRNRMEDRKGHDTLHHALFQRQLKVLAEAIQAMEADLTQLRTQLAREQVQALRDPVSGLANRLAYEQRVQQEFARWKRYDSPLALLLLGVDDFDAITHAYGRRVGDKALAVIGGILQRSLREADFIARHANELFAVLMPETRLKDVPAAAARLRNHIARSAFHYQGMPVAISVSTGWGALEAGDTPQSLWQRANEALACARIARREGCAAD
jgi:diguanylate cyclase